MANRLFAAFWILAWIGGAVAGADDGEPGAATVATASAAAATSSGSTVVVEPWIHPLMPPVMRTRLEAGFALAVARLRALPSCRELFERLGADPFETLATGLYFPVDSYRREIELCGRNVAASSSGAHNLAYTTVGGAPTYLCRHFARVDTEKAAVMVLHEALHHAGLTEWPHDRLAMRSREITEMVEEACGFDAPGHR